MNRVLVVLVIGTSSAVVFGSQFKMTSRFDQLKGFRLVNSAIENHAVSFPAECVMKCSEDKLCQSLNYQLGNSGVNCYLSNKTRRSAPAEDFKSTPGYTYYEKDLCEPNPCLFGTCLKDNSKEGFMCRCAPGYRGSLCQTVSRKMSCKDIKSSSNASHDGKYWIDPEDSGNAIQAYCDMSHDGGGWLLISNIILPNPVSIPSLTLRTSYRDIANYNDNKTVISATALRQLRQYINFTQLRFQCHRAVPGRTVNVITAANSKGYDAVDFYTGVSNIRPQACQSYYRGTGDNSQVAGQCAQWGKGSGKWGSGEVGGINEWRLIDHPLYVHGTYHWLVATSLSRIECDNAFDSALNPGDYWKIYVR